MSYTELEIHTAIQMLIQQGYAALTARQRSLVDALCAIC